MKRILALSLLACTVEPTCVWSPMSWQPPPATDPSPTCTAIIGANGTGLLFANQDPCVTEPKHECWTSRPEVIADLRAYVDTSIPRWEAIATPKVLEGAPCHVEGECRGLREELLGRQGEDHEVE